MIRMREGDMLWLDGHDVGKKLARNGQRPAAGLGPETPHNRGVVVGWRLHNGLRATPLADDYDDEVWGPHSAVKVRRDRMPHTTGTGSTLELAIADADREASAEIHRARMDYDRARRHRVWPTEVQS